MRLLELTKKDIRQIVREKQTAIFLLAMPILFTLLFGFAFGGFDAGDEEDPRLPVGILDLDQGAVSAQLVRLLSHSDVIRLERAPYMVDELEEQVTRAELAGAVVIPAGYSDTMLGATVAPIELILDRTSNAAFSVQQELEGAVSRIEGSLLTARISTAAAVTEGVAVDESLQKSYVADAFGRAIAAWEEPPVQVISTQPSAQGADENAAYGASAFAHSSPGMMAQFSIAGLMIAAQILVLERKSGCLSRLLTTELSRGSILFGHFLAMLAVILVQLMILILFGQIALRLPYFRDPAATLLLTFSAAIFAASLGMLIGVLAKSEEQAMIFSLVPMFVLAGLGGAWVPLEFTPEAFQRLASFTPITWMVDGYKDIIIRGLGLESVLVGSAVLLLYAGFCWLAAAWRFRFE